MQMFNPPHPGAILREDVLPAMSLSVTAAAAELKVSRVAFSRVLNERAAISAEMALRLADWLAGDPSTWLRMQTEYDLWKAKKTHRIKIKPAQFVELERAAEAKAKANDQSYFLAA